MRLLTAQTRSSSSSLLRSASPAARARH
jgi:hypothetical protein